MVTIIDFVIISAFMFYSGLGAATRALFGIYKVYTNIVVFKIDWKRVSIEIMASIFFGAFFTILLQEVGVFKVTLNVLAMIAGFFGSDLVDIISKKIGLTRSIQVKVTEQQVELADFNERQIKVLQYLKKTHKRITNKIYQQLAQASRGEAKSDLLKLVKKEKLRKVGSGKGSYYVMI